MWMRTPRTTISRSEDPMMTDAEATLREFLRTHDDGQVSLDLDAMILEVMRLRARIAELERDTPPTPNLIVAP